MVKENNPQFYLLMNPTICSGLTDAEASPDDSMKVKCQPCLEVLWQRFDWPTLSIISYHISYGMEMKIEQAAMYISTWACTIKKMDSTDHK